MAAGFGLFKTVENAQTIWTGATPRSSPIQVIGEDGDPARLIIQFGPKGLPSHALDTVVTLLPATDKSVITRTVGGVVSRADLLSDYTSRANLSLGSIEVELSGADQLVTVVLAPAP